MYVFQVGKISKKWTGFIHEIFTDADIFGVSFPKDLDIKSKAILLGATILIDFAYFEDNQANQQCRLISYVFRIVTVIVI